MARQRINPEGTPDRVFQPVATPVNLYYQPNLSQVELNRTAQIIDAFKEFSPRLERFTSDIVAVGIQKEKEIGAMEATQGSLGAANAKAAQAIEKAGGLTPWRYEAFLDTLGRRAVREKYQAWLYQNVDDLSALANPDGTLRGPEYAQQKMAEAYQEQVSSQFGAGSFFAAKAAADEKFKIDSQFMPSIQARHAEKLKEQNLDDAKNEMFGILSSHSSMQLVDDGREESFVKQQLKGVMEQYRRVTGTSGAEPFAKALVEWANSQADDGDYEAALTTLRAFETEDGKFRVLGTELGATYNSQIKSTIDSLEDKRDQSKLRDLQIKELMRREALRKATVLANQEIMKMAQASPTGSVSMTQVQAGTTADAMLESIEGLTQEDKDAIRAPLAEALYTKADSMNAEGRDVPARVVQIEEAIKTGDYVLADQLIDQASTDRALSSQKARQLRADIESESSRNDILPGYQAISTVNAAEFGLSSERGAILEGKQSEVVAMLGVAQAELTSKINAGWKEISQLPEDERARAASDLITRSKREVIEKYKASHKDLIESADARRSKDAVLTSKPIEGAIMASSEFIGATIGVEQADPKDRLEAEQWINDRVRTVFGEELDRLLATGMSPDLARQQIERESRMLTRKVMEEVENPSNPNVHISVRRLSSSAFQLDTGMREPTEAEVQAGAQAGLAGVVQDLSQLRRVVPDVPFGFGWAQQTIVPAIGELQRQVEEIRTKAESGDPDVRQSMESAKRSISAISNFTVDNVLKMQAPKSTFSTETVPLYTVRGGSVYAWSPAKGRYQISQEMTDNISRLRGVAGYSMDEIRQGTSKEGLKIDYARMDPARDLLVQNSGDMFKLVQEYEASGGTSGTIVNWIQAKISTGQPAPSPEALLDSQHRLLRQRAPDFTKPLSQSAK
jgi:hypothetical protein